MSAWIVSQNHIRLLVEALYKYEVVHDESLYQSPDALGQVLWQENHKSVNARYHRRNRTPVYAHDSAAMATWEYPVRSRGIIRELVRNQPLVYKQARCYRYQSCEHAGWEHSAACRLITKLLEAVEKSMGASGVDDQAPWGVQ